MNKEIWLVNDCLTCIPNTKTFWHNLLEWVPEIEDKTNGYTNFSILANKIEEDYNKLLEKPKLIIRNATYFRKLNLNVKTISLLQDPYDENTALFQNQIDVCNNSNFVVFNSEYTKNKYSRFINKPYDIIEIGTDSDLFKPSKQIKKNKNTIVYVGSSDEAHKGFSLVLDLINKTNYNFILVMKDGFQLLHERVKIYNSIDQQKLSEILNFSDVLICTSKNETLHLAGIEAAFCNTPIVASDVGIYNKIKNDKRWGVVVDNYNTDSYIDAINFVLNNNNLQPRNCMFDNELSKDNCKNKWQNLIQAFYKG
jgi:glycosyltransferase involved in cell wall biosynthesis